MINEKEEISHAKLKEALEETLGNLCNLEEEIEEDPTPFMNYVRLKETLSDLPDFEEETYEEVEPYPIRISESFEIVERDREGKVRHKTVVPKALIREEKFQKTEKNPDLIHLCSIDRIKIYYNLVSEEFWMLVLKPIWIRHKRIMQVDSWIKLQPHDIQTMKMLGILFDRDFNNPLPQTIYIKKEDRKKAKQIMRRLKA